ncbi:excalibur calcium-binding domain-containing protein [Novosphingobium sp. MW5]|nr:excalibur calcium-binding domain-containing protein [Novosphingobium sp. MW5]
MAKKSDAGCAPLLVDGVLLFVLSKCVGGSEPTTQAPQSLYAEAAPEPAQTSTALYVQTRSLRCRAEPSKKSTIVAKFARGDQVNITRYSGDWALVPDGAPSQCWVARQNLGESAPIAEAAAAVAPIAASTRNLRDRSNEGPSCGIKWKCGQMDSCEEAYHYLNQCGLGRLDGDGDGVPCESIC